jgi:2,4-dienoyl-CoA reductase (NADPH2)
MGADAIESGQADAMMLARHLLADPQFANKLRDGREDEIIWCDHQNSCLRRLILNVPVRCHKNPHTGREAREPANVPHSNE